MMDQMRIIARSAIAMCLVAAGAVSPAAQGGNATITMTATPTPLGLGQNRFEAIVKDASGRPVANAEVTLSLVMPADPKTKHPEMRTEGKLNNVGAGKYNGVAMVSMAGTWNVTVTAVQNGKTIGHSRSTLQAVATRPQGEHRPH